MFVSLEKKKKCVFYLEQWKHPNIFVGAFRLRVLPNDCVSRAHLWEKLRKCTGIP